MKKNETRIRKENEEKQAMISSDNESPIRNYVKEQNEIHPEGNKINSKTFKKKNDRKKQSNTKKRIVDKTERKYNKTK